MNDLPSEKRCPVVGIGASAGGLEAFKSFFANVSAESGLAFVLIQHLSPEHPSLMPELLSDSTQMPILQVTEPVVVEANHIYVIAPNTVLTIREGVLRVTPPTEPHGHRWPVDIFLRSLAEDQGENAAAVLLSGAGSDGAAGLQAIKRHGGQTFVQSPESCRYDSMPRAALATGVVDNVLAVEDMGARLIDFYRYREQSISDAGPDGGSGDVLESLSSICKLLTDRLGHDFSRYKQSTLVRRVQRRMQMLRLTPAASYLALLDKDEKEAEQLFKDLLIGVTEFFRDPEAFEVLANRVIPKLFQQASSSGTVRVWAAGCATGQEVYSLAILLKEYMARVGALHPVQIFATDIDSEALDTARLGFYGADIEDNVSQERLQRFFRRQENGYQVVKEIREMCIFSVHNLINDPPFSRMDLVTCRNVLIYFEAGLQQRVIPLFHYALKSGGYLLLGPAESLGAHVDSFRPVDKRLRIFQAKASSSVPSVRFPRTEGPRSSRIVMDSTFKMRQARERDSKDVHERALLDWYAPPSVLIDANGEVLHFVRRTSRFLEPPVGVPSHNIFDIVRDSLRMVLRAALNQARTDGGEVVMENIDVEMQHQVQRISLVVRPLKDGEQAVERFLVIFREEGSPKSRDEVQAPPPSLSAEVEAVNQLERELRSTKEWLQATIEELENSNEELKSSNEELISINEEYQSANESLQTSKEELQSLNEELETVNTELSKKVDELDRANADVRNFFASTGIATLFLDKELRIKKYTPTAVELFNLIETDIGRPLLDITARFGASELLAAIEKCSQGEYVPDFEVFKNENESWFICRLVPYRTIESNIDGVVVNFFDVTALKAAESALRETIAENEKLHEIGIAFASELDLGRLVQKITDVATSVTKAQFGAFFYNVLNDQGEAFTLYTISGVPRSAFEKFPMPRNTKVFESTFRGTGPLRSDDITKDPRYGKNAPHFGMPAGHLPVVSYLSVPVISRNGEVIGGLFFGHGEPGIFDAHAESRALGIAAQAAAAVDNARMVDHLRRTAHALDASERRFRQLADSMPQIVWTARPDGYLDYYNRRWYELTGQEEGLEGDESWVPVVHPDDLARCVERWSRAIETGEPYEVRFRMRLAATGEYRWYLARALPIRDEDGKITRWFGSGTDIEDMVGAENALREAADRKDEFLAMLGHELRNPLAPMKIGFHLLNLPVTTKEKSIEIRAMLERQVGHLTRIVDDLLDVSRISRGKILLRREPVDLAALAQSSISDHQMLFQSSGLALHVDIPPQPLWIEGDPTRVSQIISNLFHNASKFTDKGGDVFVSMDAVGDFARLGIRDTGMGMSPETLEQVFQPFSQADTSIDRSRGGLGLGLALVKGLVELHGGRVSAVSPGLGKGTTVSVEFPLTDQRPAAPLPTGASLAVHARRIVIIEDNADAADALCGLLRGCGHDVITAANGKAGLAATAEHGADVVICDIGLPGDLNGYDVAKRLRAEASGSPLLLIALSGYGQEQDRLRATEAGFDHHFTKPIDIDQLDKVLSR
jgi:two-component system CheB/CheR fusion protein